MKSAVLLIAFTVYFTHACVAQLDTVQVDNKSIALAYKKVNGPDDWENVSITRAAKEVRTFRQVGTVSANLGGSVGVTSPPLTPIRAIGMAVSNVIAVSSTKNGLKKRVFRRLQKQCAMSGGNLIHITESDSASSLPLGMVRRSAAVSMAGILYTTSPLNAEEFRNKLKGKTTFTCVEKIEMSVKDSDYTKSQFDSVFNLNYVVFETGLLYAIGALNNVHTGQFRVIGFTDKQFYLMRKVKSTTYNYIINF